jgi:hypothetical protein
VRHQYTAGQVLGGSDSPLLLAGAVVLGEVFAPVDLVYGITTAAATSAMLLLNLKCEVISHCTRSAHDRLESRASTGQSYRSIIGAAQKR